MAMAGIVMLHSILYIVISKTLYWGGGGRTKNLLPSMVFLWSYKVNSSSEVPSF